MRVVFLGTPDFAAAALKALLESRHEVSLVVTQPDRPAGRGKKLMPPPVKVLAEEHGLPVYQPEKINTRDARARVADARPDVIVVVAFGQILRPLFLKLAPQGCLNVHASILPRHRGASPINAQILHGDEKVGVSLMRMDEGLDTGPVAAIASRDAISGETAGELHDRLAPIGGSLLVEVLDRLESEDVTFEPQDDASSTYAGLMKKSDGALDFRGSAEELERRVRGLHPWPGTYADLLAGDDAHRLEFLEVKVADGVSPEAAPGEVLDCSPDGILIACGEGALLLKRLKPKGRKPMAVRDYLNGARLQGALRFQLPAEDAHE